MPRSAHSLTVNRFFSPHGLLSRWHPNYEFRPGQLEMALEVEAALEEQRPLIVEAGTGTGKTLAYLVPAILSGKRVIVSTGTKTLQDQLFYKDIPFLQRHLDRAISVCYMKGRNNYACRQKIYDAEKEPILSGLEEVSQFELIREWEKTTLTGDRSEIRHLPEDSSLWAKIDARRDRCPGQKCPQFDRCFITLMRRRAAESDIVIVNHHLFFADLASRDDDFGGILPSYAAVIFDEAHEIEEVAGQYFGISVSNHQLHELRRDIASLARRKGFGSGDLDRLLDCFSEAIEQFFNLFPEEEGRTACPPIDPGGPYRNLQASLAALTARLELVREAVDELIPIHRRLRELSEALAFLVETRYPDYVYWFERRGRGGYLQATPVDVSSILAERLFSKVPTVILTSATLAVAGSFEYTQKRLGLPSARTLIVSGLFDYSRQALLYVPPELPDPRNPEFTDAAANETVRLLELTQGRAFVLFTSYSQMQQIYERVAPRIPYPTFLQGTAPKIALLESFRSTPNSVLFATSSFWQGVDVPGEQLSMVIIDRLPFAVPTDPVVEARVRAIRERGGNPFYEYQVPQAALTLKQGFGRLIRTRTDRGVLALLDNRIIKQSYGRFFFASLPDYRFTTDIEEVKAFWQAA